jgi:hypothetical protein
MKAQLGIYYPCSMQLKDAVEAMNHEKNPERGGDRPGTGGDERSGEKSPSRY